MSKPAFSKPFDIISAKAGAPYCCRDGGEAIVLKWDGRRFNESLVGCIGADDGPASWSADGSYMPGEHGARPRDLVMLPLGLIDGKPVFVGDKITSPDCKGDTTAHHKMNFGEKSTWAWPASAPTYPVTLMTDGDLVSNYYGGGPVSHEQEYQAWRRIANAALRHAIDAGQVVPSAVHDKATRALIRGGWQDLGGQEWKPKIGEKPAYIRDEERDLDVAKAVQAYVIHNLSVGSTARFFAAMNLNAIIVTMDNAKNAKEGAK